ncbi:MULTISPECIES: succinate dehydrogenase cytochrome b subunit [Chitinophagaceae]|uniref:succinate dehydrogenase cytochrome b subunit n=1 Tax=Chitinophagaceae TaxID=563835 RepID=UPI000DEF677E|nr:MULTISPECIES: succinate dehydrogenase cytochrome b subunit [Chitinophagaceae]RPD51450.1 succinate dehydrogenase cytochrome b subunit [Paracnuella aquatica]
MKWSYFFTSAIGKKIVMGLTGLFLVSFLIIHVGLNACIFADLSFLNPNDDGEMFNRAAHFMGSTIVTRLLELVLFAGFILHIIQGWQLEVQNRRRRGQGYAVDLGNRGSKWYSRSMGLLGTIIFLFLIVHISAFWWPSRVSHDLAPVSYGNGVEMHNLYLRMYEVFQNPYIVLLYLVACASLLFHLMHGFHSAFRTMGVHNRKYLTMLKSLGYGFAIVVSVLFALMPVAMYLQWVKPGV